MLPSCRQVAVQLSEDRDEKITGFKRFALKLHLSMCRHCRRYGKQLELSTKTINLLAHKSRPDPQLKAALIDHFTQLSVQRKSEDEKPQ
ncbi:hypothetical protein [Aliikangiella sp. G2MR2-5]|uniref:anti-sigma factor family protein n=1 Tax=Aliikangiella sp. G2MR2-5 TaxID=2788943 RepID=UPI0018AAF79A|nr:hypothetical protein [Aliikangiella sp. G2MR2-5]